MCRQRVTCRHRDAIRINELGDLDVESGLAAQRRDLVVARGAMRLSARRIQDDRDHLGYYRKVLAAVPPGPKGGVLLGSLPEARRDPLAFVLRLSAEYGDVVCIRLLTLRVFLLNHPDDIEQVLVTHQHRFIKGRSLGRARQLFGEGLLTSDGDLHARQRKLVQPAFHRQRLASYAGMMMSATAAARERWGAGDTIDIAAEMSGLTLAIAARLLFGDDSSELIETISGTLDAATNSLEVALLPLAPIADQLPLPHVRRMRAARAAIDAVLDDVIERRRQQPGDDDLASMLLRLQQDGSAEGMSDAQLRDELRTLLLAGHETTAHALAWTWYLLARHPDVERRVHAEIDAVLGGRLPTADAASALPYVRMVLAESMRLYPPAWLLGRTAVADYEARGYLVPAGSLVVLSPWGVHRNPVYFPDPERFDPDRWIPESQARRPRFSYFPFGGGSRGCMGEAVAWMEGVLIVAALAQRWRFRLVDETAVPELLPAITLKPKNGIQVVVRSRTSRGSA